MNISSLRRLTSAKPGLGLRSTAADAAHTASLARAPRLRTMAVADLDQVCDIEATCYAFPWTRGNFIDSMAAGYWCQGLVDAQDRLLGYLIAMDGFEETHLLNITVARDAQGQGHARGMLDALCARSLALGSLMLWLEVRPSNTRAHALYRRYGFEDVGVRRDYYPDAGGRREDALVMRRVLDETKNSPERMHGLD